MSVFYTLAENKIKSSKSKGKWFARATPLGTKTTNDLAEIIQRNCTVKKSDILAVLSEFSEVLSSFLKDGYRVKVDNLGTFKVGLSSTGAMDPTEFKETENIKGSHVSFRPEMTWNRTARKYTADVIDGATYANITTRGSEKEMTKRKESMDETTQNNG